MNFLEERKILQNMIKEKDYITALTYFNTNFTEHTGKNENFFKKIILCIRCLEYLGELRLNDYNSAYQILNSFDQSYWTQNITVSLYDHEDKVVDYNLEVIIY
jgi:hypothetical protein